MVNEARGSLPTQAWTTQLLKPDNELPNTHDASAVFGVVLTQENDEKAARAKAEGTAASFMVSKNPTVPRQDVPWLAHLFLCFRNARRDPECSPLVDKEKSGGISSGR